MPKTFKWYYGTPEGGKHAAETNKKKYGNNFYAEIGRKGGQISRGGGFAAMPKEKVREAGRKGGSISRRGPGRKPSHLDEDPIIPKMNLNASSNFVEHVNTKKKFRWPWSK